MVSMGYEYSSDLAECLWLKVFSDAIIKTHSLHLGNQSIKLD